MGEIQIEFSLCFQSKTSPRVNLGQRVCLSFALFHFHGCIVFVLSQLARTRLKCARSPKERISNFENRNSRINVLRGHLEDKIRINEPH